ncbi:MAG: TrkA family potassium uptake protein [Ignavibacteriaceae bacterium]|nr:TrkA family potassium uptake protein [Ignavibacteriaceae bacterium]
MRKKIAVIGLGHFGEYLCLKLTDLGSEVLAIDRDREKLDQIKDVVIHTVCLDSCDLKVLRTQGLEEFDAVVIALRDNFEETLLTIMNLQKIGVKRIIVRAVTAQHQQILQHLGVAEILLPEEETAIRLAQSLTMKNIIDSFSLNDDYIIIEAEAPGEYIGRSLKDLELRKNFGVSLITIRRMAESKGVLGIGKKNIEKIIGIPDAGTVIERGDILVVFGPEKNIKKVFGRN